MAAIAASNASVQQRDLRWKRLLLSLCAVACVLIIASVADTIGVSGRPWFGLWEALTAVSDRAYVGTFTQILPGGASAKAGLHDGDLFDLREQSVDARVRFAFQPIASRPFTLQLHRGARAFSATLRGASIWDGATSTTSQVNLLSNFLWATWFLACATLIAAYRWWRYEARVLALVMLCQIFSLFNGSLFVVPSAALQLLFSAAASFVFLLQAILLIALSSRYGTRTAWRRPLELFAYAANAVWFLMAIVALVGIVTLWFDPMPYLSILGSVSGGNVVLASLAGTMPPLTVAVCALAAVATSPPAERPRAAWLLLPLPLALGASTVTSNFGFLVSNYYLNVGLQIASSACLLLGAFIVSYALLKRRVLDFGFVLSRTVVVGIVSVIVVGAFVLLEWVLGPAVAGASHATGLIANAALALVLGVSLNYIHQRVDRLVDAALFRKRHDDERALRDFSKEAASFTNLVPLLDQTVKQVEAHTDARSAALFLKERVGYIAARSFGENPTTNFDENDSAVLALKTWHKPLDPHHYDTAIHGALALPMLARGRLIGVLLLGERTGGEAYAPDEVEALSQVAHGVGTALDSLSARDGESTSAFQQVVIDGLASLSDSVRALQATTEAALRNNAGDARLGSSSD